MPKEDYFLKYIEKLNRVIAAMFGFREKGFPEDALRLAQEAYKEMLDLDLDALAGMPEADFEILLDKENIHISYLEYLAEILKETAEAYDKRGKRDTAILFYQKSMATLIFLTQKDKTFSWERESKINQLKEIINT